MWARLVKGRRGIRRKRIVFLHPSLPPLSSHPSAALHICSLCPPNPAPALSPRSLFLSLLHIWDQKGCIWYACSQGLSCPPAQVCFERPAVPTSLLVYLASDGTIPSNQRKPRVTVQLSDIDGLNRSLGEQPTGCGTSLCRPSRDIRSPYYCCDLSLVLLSPIPPLAASSASQADLLGCVRGQKR